MDWQGIAAIASAVAMIIVGIYAGSRTRKSDKEDNEVDRFEANIRAFDIRAKAAERDAEAARLDAKAAREEAAALTLRVDKLETLYAAQGRQLNRIKKVVQDWFVALSAAWDQDKPMPLPSDDDLRLLEITVPPKRNRKETA